MAVTLAWAYPQILSVGGLRLAFVAESICGSNTCLGLSANI
ncbi:MAG: hypothetical protein RR033_01770 [Clostridia bacterium]